MRFWVSGKVINLKAEMMSAHETTGALNVGGFCCLWGPFEV